MRWATLLSVVNHSTKYPSSLLAAAACLKDARSGNQDDASGPATTPPTYILDPPHFYYHDQDSCPDMIPIKIYDTENPMQLAMRVKLLELALMTFENFQLAKGSGGNYYFFHLWTCNDKVRDELISDFWSCMNEGLVIPLNNQKDKAKWQEINGAYSSRYLADYFAKLTRAINCHQNWNSYAAGAGTSISNLALMLVNIGANISTNFEYTLPHASELRGSCYYIWTTYTHNIWSMTIPSILEFLTMKITCP